ncbi:uncharacterized protein LACBIDRAFT_295121 [Laccaria bicolor S238N-H82]|uniref:Carboxylic ester hydrolase n=1 Tax=Laccaria bicolor (strain S238N-H82 / ATCC MYA-4686) TaxID=486041 RepID=B0DMR2_LACBS|nr:uncharacterized protein LACBIDRAFT_295121 [Laccaria bicolor S238N-H82]EDR04100.1 predicted protein [Laccaria bicolor S238N-H82]|eukprot:XP_001885355.1 predicted protein [Laccaria bicolor S238N-H82]
MPLLRTYIFRLVILSVTFLVLATYTFRERLLSITVASIRVLSSRDQDIIGTGYAKYQGNRTFPNTVAYLGIPYAEPPLGDRRFRAPVPLDTGRIARSSRSTVVDATKYPDSCIQGTTGGGDAGGAGSEDCLKVNIYAPVGAKRGSNLPVLVYIHGGANWPFDHWIQQSPNVVIVSVYYRLSSFGFLATPAFRDPAHGDLNAGFLDQIEALRWVKRYIAAFGGDPTKVTINGESAGGSSVGLHLVAEEGEVLFRAAIVQSLYRTPLPSPEEQESLFQFYARTAGCHAGSVSSTMACLRNASVSALAHAQDAAMYSSSCLKNISISSGYKVFHPVVDGKIITDFPTKSILNDKFARIPLIVGTVTDSSAPGNRATTNETLSGGTDLSAALKRFFPSLSDDGIAAIERRTLMGESFALHSNVWTYRYNQPNPTSPGSEVRHAAENWMMFRGTNTGRNGTTTYTPMSPIATAFAEELIAYWLSFVRSGNPNTYRLTRSPTWSRYAKGNRMRMVLQQNPGQILSRSGSVLEEGEEETGRCALVGRLAVEMEN